MGVKVKSAMSPGDLGGPQSPPYKATKTPKKQNGKKLDYTRTGETSLNGAAAEKSTVVTNAPPKKKRGLRCVRPIMLCW